MPSERTTAPSPARDAVGPPPGVDDDHPIPWWGFAGAGFVLFAVAAELIASTWANSPAPSWLEPLAPLAWPTALRVLWWLAVAAGVGAFHAGAAVAGHRRHPAVVALTVAPFVAFAVGIGFGAEWATWH